MLARGSRFLAWRHVTARLRHSGSAFVSLLDQGVVSGFGFLTGIATARLLDIEMFGRFALVMIVIGLAQNVHNALVTAPMMTIIGTRPHQQRTYHVSLLAWALILSIAEALVVAAILAILFVTRGDPLPGGFLAAAACLALAQNMQFTLRRLLFARMSGGRALAMDMARALAFPVAAVLTKIASGTLTVEAMLWLLAGTASITSLPLARPLFRGRHRGLRFGAVVGRHLPLARWLLPVVIITFGQEQVVWIVAAGILGDKALGGLRAAQYVVGVVVLFMAATENVIPVGAGRALTQSGPQGLRRYLLSAGFMLGLLVLVLLLAVAIPAPLLLEFVFGKAFVPYATCLRLLALAVVFIFVRDMATQWFRATQRTGTIFRAFTASLVVSLAVLYPLLSRGGLNGAALVVLIGHVTSMIYLLGAASSSGGTRNGLGGLIGDPSAPRGRRGTANSGEG